MKATIERTPLADLLRERRQARDLRVVEVIEKAGCSTLEEGCDYLRAIERGEVRIPEPTALERFAQALELDEEAVRVALEEELEILHGPSRPQIIVRLMPAFYTGLEYPEGLSDEEVVEFAAAFSKKRRKRVCVVLSPVRSVYVEPDGRRETKSGAPSMRIGDTEVRSIDLGLEWSDDE